MVTQAQVRRALVQEITPHVATVAERRALVQAAYTGEAVIRQVNYEGSADVFAGHLIEVAVSYNGGAALLPLLVVLRDRVGEDRAARFSRLMRAVRAVSWDPPPTSPLVPPSPEPRPRYEQTLDKYEAISKRLDAIPGPPPPRQATSLTSRIRQFIHDSFNF